MKILIINPYYFPNMQGGTEQVVKLLAEEYVRVGHDVAVLTGDSPKDKLQKDNVNGVIIYRGVKGKFVMHPEKGNQNPLLIKVKNNINHRHNIPVEHELEDVIDNFKPDVIHTQNLYGFSSTIWKVAHKKNIRVIHTLHDYWLLEPKFKKWAQNNSKYVDCVTAPSAYTLEEFQHGGLFDCTNSAVVPNGIPVNIEYHKRIVEQKRSRSDTTIRFLYVGQLIEKKGLLQLLDAYSNLSTGTAENLKTELHICGTGYLKDNVLQATEKDKSIIYHGFVDKDGLTKVYEQCDVLVAPSIWAEPFGMVAIEAFYHGLTVIAGNTGGLNEIMQNMKVGRAVDPTVDNLVETMKYYCDREHIIADIDSLKEGILQYSINNQASGFLKLYKQ
ncbi:MAG: glycosyltransferase family 4 protein [Ruminococcus sp.]|nr:glycosyltransferase family 4 protein [Ruminococcus sp.]